VIEFTRQFNSDELKIVYLEDYDRSLGALLTGGVDLWLNTPKRPYEASGTSGMKAVLNGVPSRRRHRMGDHDTDMDEANSLYEQLEKVILPLFYGQLDAWRRIMRSTIALNGPYFNTQRTLEQYVLKAYAGVSPGVGSGSGALVSEHIRHLSRFRHFGCFQPSQKVHKRKFTKTIGGPT
jgi:glycogen phosphorylase